MGTCGVDAVLDIAFIAFDIYQIAANGRKGLGSNLINLGLDGVGLATPCVTGLGAARRGAGLTDDAADLARKFWRMTPEGTENVLLHPQFGKFYKHNTTGNWWTKDRARHGGSHWKEYVESPNGLQHWRDADEYGDYINKHKGPSGRFIPWKDFRGL